MRGRRRWWAGGLVAAWAAALLVAAVWSSQHDPPTVREQSPLAEGRQTLDQALALVVDTAGAGVTAELGPQRTVGCRVSLTRPGSELDQSVRLTVPAGEEPALLERLAADLPADWDARYHAGRNRFFADAGDFVAIRGEAAGSGQVRLTAETGCRPD